MTTRYRVEYALKTHRRDQFIEWIKGLLAVPFVLYSQPAGVYDRSKDVARMSQEEAHRRYAEIMRDVEAMIDDHIAHQHDDQGLPSKLKLLVPTVGPFFTRLPLEAAFKFQDRKRYISSRRFVSPSFNDFLSAGANDFRARVVGTTAWIANPAETVGLLDELAGLMGKS
ncbi:IMP-specific 5'-nucleotidase 1 [Magnaporthiopsis poae ATCC 64411]|uniref:IMP-specific 5'-nucleotidase 1 n=1 Tax=Magnaporthiopsis poae (strain ATCC 64411 / 73-15) TaxID=644358 RepID=A0A0C4ECW2_MAGP6|nr:IMP-specific 5'-nucleotidase 1 [Magnaporthiopsis poae ATCC 64411]